ncbi:hypothetical protein E1286_35370 [Nonomuraea terrae]|uniref:Uncharacterized protein n=1 Tax=Nonomuraea terrae TaxID=2530383 RepID=A0A4R4Y4P8_9ACTN|nr:hypothetical protein [Nonomuraea terrae]TDD39351.1 hypothetical protein E1286_35370 [Nonomuraea terrae]
MTPKGPACDTVVRAALDLLDEMARDLLADDQEQQAGGGGSRRAPHPRDRPPDPHPGLTA